MKKHLVFGGVWWNTVTSIIWLNQSSIIHRHSFCFCSTLAETRQFIHQETGIKHSRSVCWTTNIDWAVLAAADSFKQTKSWKISCCKNKSVFPHSWSFFTKIYLWFPFSILLLTPLEGGVFYMLELIKARLHKHCTYCGCETLKSHHNSLMCPWTPVCFAWKMIPCADAGQASH